MMSIFQYCCSRRFHIVWLCNAALHCSFLLPLARGDDAPTADEVLAAWKQRDEASRSLQYHCNLELRRAVLQSKGKPGPFGGKPDQEAVRDVVTLQNAVIFSKAADKIAYLKEGDSWNERDNSTTKTTYRKAFDGSSDRYLSVLGPLPLGEVSTGGQSSAMLMLDIELLPFWLPFHTKTILERIGYDVSKLKVSEASTFRDGVECTRLTIPFVGGNEAIYCNLYVVGSRQFLPIAFEQVQKSWIRFSTSIEYSKNDDNLWTPSTMRSTQFDQHGEPKLTWSYAVTNFTLNEPLDEEVFNVEFPVGTHVVEGEELLSIDREGKKKNYYIELGNGKRQAITENEFGVVPPKVSALARPSYLVMGNVMLAVVLFLAFFKKRAKND